jgi:hypothetical protein
VTIFETASWDGGGKMVLGASLTGCEHPLTSPRMFASSHSLLGAVPRKIYVTK